MNEIVEMIYQWHQGGSIKSIERSLGFDRKTIRKYVKLAQDVGVHRGESFPPQTVYITNIPCESAGVFSGPLVVSMRPIPWNLVTRAVQITSRFPKAHGAPVQVGSPHKIGIRDLKRVDYGVAPEIGEDEIPVFWACGVTPQAVAIQCEVPFMITHVPSHMFVTDWRVDEITYE